MQFRGSEWFLSNMYPCQIDYNGCRFSCVESAFQAQKDLARSHEFQTLNGKEAKALGRKVQLRDDWESVKDDIMKDLIQVKFKDPKLADKLMTNPTILAANGRIQEDNTWGDRYWGVCNGRGQNRLGQILMEQRAELLRERNKAHEQMADRMMSKVQQTDSEDALNLSQ